MKLLIGLGNPGARYANNRHNVGFLAVEAIAARYDLAPWKRRFQGEAVEGRIGDQKVLLLKPATFMNESGRSAGEAARFYKLSIEDLIVFHDDLDLAPGRVKIKQGGGHAGHNGLKSLTAHCGADFWRVRIGIGHPGEKAKVTAHVLGDFAKADGEWLDPLLQAIADAAPALVSGDQARFASDVAQAMQDVQSTGKQAPQRETSAPVTGTSKQDTPSKPTALGEKLRRWLSG